MGGIKIISRYLNVKVDNDVKDCEKMMECHGIEKMNDNEELFAVLCTNHDLVIGDLLLLKPQQTQRNIDIY